MLTIRLFAPDDVFEISRITRESLGESYPTSFFLSIYQYWPEGFLVATENGMFIGFVVGVISRARQARILMLAVRESHRRAGIAVILLRAFISSCMQKGLDSIILEVRTSNIPAINLYTKLRFRIVENLRSYYRDGGDGLRMELVLQS